MRKVAFVVLVAGGGVLSGCASYLEPLNIIKPSFSYARDDAGPAAADSANDPVGPAVAAVPTR